jgi:hypothetical protein
VALVFRRSKGQGCAGHLRQRVRSIYIRSASDPRQGCYGSPMAATP